MALRAWMQEPLPPAPLPHLRQQSKGLHTLWQLRFREQQELVCPLDTKELSSVQHRPVNSAAASWLRSALVRPRCQAAAPSASGTDTASDATNDTLARLPARCSSSRKWCAKSWTSPGTGPVKFNQWVFNHDKGSPVTHLDATKAFVQQCTIDTPGSGLHSPHPHLPGRS